MNPLSNLMLSRKEGMGTFIEFASLLEKKIRKDLEQGRTRPSSENKTFSSEIPSELWTRLVGHLDPKRFSTSAKGDIYHRHRPPPRPRPAHQMDEGQQKAFQFFSHAGQTLADNFSLADLKKAFRLLALKLHPDQGGRAHDFQTLLQARDCLQKLFT